MFKGEKKSVSDQNKIIKQKIRLFALKKKKQRHKSKVMFKKLNQFYLQKKHYRKLKKVSKEFRLIKRKRVGGMKKPQNHSRAEDINNSKTKKFLKTKNQQLNKFINKISQFQQNFLPIRIN